MDSQDFMNISYHIIHVSCMKDRPIHGSLEKSLRGVVLPGKTGVCVQPRDPLVFRMRH